MGVNLLTPDGGLGVNKNDNHPYLYPKATSPQFRSKKISIRTESPPISHANVSMSGLPFLRPHLNSAYQP